MFKEEIIPLAPSQNQLRQDIRFLSKILAEIIREQNAFAGNPAALETRPTTR